MKIAAIATAAVLAGQALLGGGHAPHYAPTGWEGYTLNSTSRVSTDFIIPNVTGTNGETVAYWAGFGQGNPGIQQAGITGTIGHGWTAWYEMWPADPVAFHPPVPPHAGDTMQFIATFSAGVYTLSVNDVSKGWTQSTRQASPDLEGYGEAICEAYSTTYPLPDHMGNGKFFNTSSPLGSPYTFPFGGTTLKALGTNSFQVSKP